MELGETWEYMHMELPGCEGEGRDQGVDVYGVGGDRGVYAYGVAWLRGEGREQGGERG